MSPKVAKCETQIISGFVTWSVKILLQKNVEMRKHEIPLWINAWSQPWACEGRRLQVVRLHFMIGIWKSQSDSQQIREVKNCEMHFRIRLWS
jgi:hypothetical protein